MKLQIERVLPMPRKKGWKETHHDTSSWNFRTLGQRALKIWGGGEKGEKHNDRAQRWTIRFVFAYSNKQHWGQEDSRATPSEFWRVISSQVFFTQLNYQSNMKANKDIFRHARLQSVSLPCTQSKATRGCASWNEEASDTSDRNPPRGEVEGILRGRVLGESRGAAVP